MLYKIYEIFLPVTFFLELIGTYYYIFGYSIGRVKRGFPYIGILFFGMGIFLLKNENRNIEVTILILVIIIVMFLVNAEKHKLRHSLVILPVIFGACLPGAILELLLHGFTGIFMNNIDSGYFMIFSDYFTLFLLALLCYCNYKWSYRKRISSSDRYMISITTMIIAIGYFAISELQTIDMFGKYNQIVSIITFSISCILISFVTIILVKEYKEGYYKELSQLNEKNTEQLLRHFEAYRDAQEDTRRVRHDMRNHLTCIRLLLEEGKIDELKEYLDEMNQVMEQLVAPIQTGNVIVDAILGEKAQVASKDSIILKVEGKVPSKLEIKSVDWCTIVANAVDNGIEALRKLPDASQRIMNLMIQTNGNYMSMTFTNPCKAEVQIRNGIVRTSKKEKLQHGFGVQNIRKVCEKYHGDYLAQCFKEDANWMYQLQIIIPIHAISSSQNQVDSSQNETARSDNSIIEVSKRRRGVQDMELNKKQIKKEMNHVGLALIGYLILQTIGVFVYMLGYTIRYAIANPDKADTISDKEFAALINTMFAGGWIYFISIAFALIAIIFYRRRKLFTNDLVVRNKKMIPKVLVGAIICMLGIQFIFTIVGTGLEYLFNQFGYSLSESIEQASQQSTTISMFIYASIIGPIVEEIIFRGAVLRSMEKYGKVFAIAVSALLFGAFHGNLVQGIFAFFVGVVLGYVTIEYSIKWSIVLHMINNILADVINTATNGFSEQVSEMIGISIFFFGFLASMLLIYLRRSEIRKFLEENRTNRCYYGYFFSRVGVILFILLGIVLSVMGITKI